ncbi:hypothetical protein [Streptomyces sp. NBC_01207]|uniref:hypothetical protein n=1 Tax=Streptomyces sp. NBC_01207 TaxID=2903772 RepID=UPI002E129DCA|nr:hypothetical protein OG457_31280 [Streptomyces sp. NBC_01207]
MTQLTHAQISDAKNNDLDAVSSIIRETEELVNARARRFATTGGHTDTDLAEDLAQVGRITIWEALGDSVGDDPAQFMACIDRGISRAMADARREATRPGVSIYTTKRFEKAIALAAGDPYDAEKIAASDAMGDDKLSPDLAYSARLSWMGSDSLDRLIYEPGFMEGISSVSLADAISAETGVPAYLLDANDIAAHRREVIRSQVHRILGKLSERQRHVLKAAHGISPVPQYVLGADDAELGAELGATAYQVQQARTKGQKRFSELYRAGAQTW